MVLKRSTKKFSNNDLTGLHGLFICRERKKEQKVGSLANALFFVYVNYIKDTSVFLIVKSSVSVKHYIYT